MRNNVTGVSVSLLLVLAGLAMAQSVPLWEPRDFSFKSSTEHNNPFAVTFSATAKAPNGETLHLPGFYDGDGTWKIRFSPFLEGKWSLKTNSDDPALTGKQVELTCTKNANLNVHGPLQVDSQHPHWFVFRNGSRGYIMGYEADWLWALDMTAPDTPKLNAFLDKLKHYGFNYIVLNAYAHDTSWRKGRTSEDDYGPPPLFAWEGTNENPDHSRFNLAYWRHYDRMMNALHERGIIAHLMFKVYNKSVNWPQSGSAEDELWFRWIVARYAAFPNLVWDFSKESFYEKDVDYKTSRLKLIRENDPYRHLITIHDDNGYDKGTFDDLVDFQADQNHGDGRHKTILNQRSRGQWPVMNIEFGYEHGPGGLQDKTYGGSQSPEVVCRRAWELATAGAYLTYYYTYTAWDVVRTEDTPPGYGYFKILRDFWDAVPYWTMRPADHLVDQGYCLADEGRHYVVYLPDAGPVNLTFGNSRGRFKVEWLHPFTGQRVAGELAAQDKCLLTPPAEFEKTPIVLHVRNP